MPTMSVSTYSVREQLGPLEFTFTDPSGNEVRLVQPATKELHLSDFPARAKTAFGVDAIETVAFQFKGIDDPELDRFAGQLQSSGVRLLNAAIDEGDLLETDPGKRGADIAAIKKWIDRFAAMGSTFIRVNPCAPMSPDDGQPPPRHLVEALRELGAYAATKGPRLLVENHGGLSSNPVWLNQLLESVGADYCGLLLDLGNFDVVHGPVVAHFLGEARAPKRDPGQDTDRVVLSSIYAHIYALAPRAELVHLKAQHVGEDGAVGPIDLPRAMGILSIHGYRGPFTVEYEGSGGDPWAKSARVLEVAAASLQKAGR